MQEDLAWIFGLYFFVGDLLLGVTFTLSLGIEIVRQLPELGETLRSIQKWKILLFFTRWKKGKKAR